LATDRFGARRLLLIGSVLTGAGFVLFSQIDSLGSFYLVFIFLSVSSSLLFPVPGWTAVAGWFVRKRGTAIGILSAAIGVGGGLIYVVNALIIAWGWRVTLVIIGLGMWVIGIPCSLIVRHRPEPYGLAPDGEKRTIPETGTAGESTGGATDPDGEFSLRKAMKTRTFWVIALAVTVSAATVHAVTVHVMPYLLSAEFSREAAGLTASLLVFVSIAGRFGLGWFSGRVDSRYLLALGVGLQALGLLFLAWAKGLGWIATFIITFGPGYGGVITLRLTLQAEYFGRRAFGSIQGAFMGLMIIGTMSFPLLTGVCYDFYGNYRPAWLVMAAANFAMVPLALRIKPPKRN
jgi:sugar phosphate permease